MIDAHREREAAELLRDGSTSRRAIARLTGLSRPTIEAMADGSRPLDRSRRAAERRARGAEHEARGPVGKCLVCGGQVELPCRTCHVRRLVAEGKLPKPTPDPTDETELSIDLLYTDEEQYLEIRRRHEAGPLVQEMLKDAEQAARDDPQDVAEPTDAELIQSDAELIQLDLEGQTGGE